MAVSDPLVVKESFLSAEARADAAKTIPVRATTGARHDGPTPRQRWRKRGLVALAVVLGPYIAYVVLLNLAFATGLFTWLVNKGTPDFRMEIGTAWMCEQRLSAHSSRGGLLQRTCRRSRRGAPSKSAVGPRALTLLRPTRDVCGLLRTTRNEPRRIRTRKFLRIE